LDGYRRSIVHWDLRRPSPNHLRENGPQFIARDFKEFIRISGMTHVRKSPYYPQSNGKIERWHKSLKGECIRQRTPLTKEDARHTVWTVWKALRIYIRMMKRTMGCGRGCEI
jgi:transposase InsO family protein